MKKSISLIVVSITTFLLCSCNSLLEKLYVYQNPRKMTYNVGEYFNSDGIGVMNEKTGQEVTNFKLSPQDGYQFTKEDATKTYKTITVTSTNYNSTSFNVSVVDLITLTLSGNYKTEYDYGDYFSLDGLIVKAGDKVITNYKSSLNVENKLTKVGVIEVTISADGYYSATYNITVRAQKRLNITSKPTRTSYEVGDTFSTAGLVVKDGNGVIVDDYDISLEDGSILKYESNDLPVTVSKEGYESASFTIKVAHKATPTLPDTEFTIYYINDTHGAYMRKEVLYKDEAGISYIGKYLKDKKEDDPDGTVILSGGDMFEGGYETNETKGLIMCEAMNSIGFDAMVLGNHEFDWGEATMKNMVEALDCDVLSVNTFYSDAMNSPDYLVPYTIVEKGDLTIGIIGGLQENIGTSITGEVSDKFKFPSPNEYVKKYSTELRLNHNCDIVIGAFHDAGFEGYTGEPLKFNDLTQTDPKTNRKYVDAMFFAHDHARKSGSYNGVPYLEAQCNGIIIGEMTLNVRANGLIYEPYNYSTKLTWAYDNCTEVDPDIEEINVKYADVIAKAQKVLYTFKNSHTKASFLTICCQAMIWYVNNYSERFNNVTVNFASSNTGAVRVSSVKAGAFTYADLVAAYPFDNSLTIQKCTETNINYMKNYDYFATVTQGTIVYKGGYTNAVSISYISNHAYYKTKAEVSHVEYSDYTSKMALEEYLLLKIDPNL